MTTFYSYTEKALRVGATTPDGGRLRSSVSVDIAAVEDPGTVRSIPASYELFGPGDVVRLGSAAIRRRFPVPGTSDAEWEKRAHVEFTSHDLPWRYTPRAAADGALRPWLVLVVGQAAPDEIVLRPDGRVGIGVLTQQLHPLTGSAQWAHLHDTDTGEYARVLSPAPLAQGTSYLACLVPGFAADGSDAWTGADAVVSDCYDRWSFRTSELGDFPDLAGKLHKADLAAIDAAGKPFGRAEVAYSWRDGHAPDVTLDAVGALRLPPDGQPDPADAPPDPALATEVTALSERLLTPDGRGVVTAPRYDAAFVTAATQDSFATGGWVDQLRGDPRARGDAGLGSWNAIMWQDRIAEVAATKAADLPVAHDRIRNVALGIEVSRSVWRRRVPTLDGAADKEAAAASLLDVLGPSLGRLPTDTGGTVLDAVDGRTPRLVRALFSSAARRASRPGPARTALTADGAGSLPAALLVANQCVKRGDDPADVPAQSQVTREQMEENAKAALFAVAPDDGELVEKVLDRLFANGRTPTPGDLAAAARALAPDKDGHADPKAVDFFLNSDHRNPDVQIGGWSAWVDENTPVEDCRPIDMVGLAHAVSDAIDPTVAMPPAARRVLATLPGISHFGTVEIEPELDLPLWSFLAQSAPNWMLPGAGDLVEGDVVALATNPPFVQALLAGANTQATSELRWRNIAMTTGWSPLRKFWQRTGGAMDIDPIKAWPDTDPLGGPGLTAPDAGAEAVVAFKTPLFRRYPATVVYLYKAKPGWVPPAEGEALTADRVDHTFTGTIGDDITFFGFPVAPDALSTYWVVLEEPPAGFRFYQASQFAEPAGVSAAQFAFNRFAVPVRVLIGPLL